MEIAVLLKQVPATESLIEIADDGTSIKTDGINWVMNPYDEMAVEEALQIRDAVGGAVTVFSLGPEKAVEALRTALAMGADKGVHINDPAAEGSDALATAKILAAALKEFPFDLVIAGHRAVDPFHHDDITLGYQVENFPVCLLPIGGEGIDELYGQGGDDALDGGERGVVDGRASF